MDGIVLTHITVWLLLWLCSVCVCVRQKSRNGKHVNVCGWISRKLIFFLFSYIAHTHRMLQRSTAPSSVRCFRSSMDIRPSSVSTGRDITTPCLTAIGCRGVSDTQLVTNLYMSLKQWFPTDGLGHKNRLQVCSDLVTCKWKKQY